MGFWINAIIWAIIIGVGIRQAKPKPLTLAFIISLYVGLESYAYVSDWLSYLPTGKHLLFYAIPICLFLLSSFVFCKKTHSSWEDAMSNSSCWYIGVIIAVWLSLPTMFVLYEWEEAKIEYETEMEEIFGEDWEDEVDYLKQERFSHHP